MKKTIGAVALVALVLSGIALAAAQKDSYKVSSTLKARTEVPRPSGVPAGATGGFTGTAVELANDKARVTWKLTFSQLSGKAIAAHIHLGKVGKAATRRARAVRSVPERPEGIRHADPRPVREARGRRGVRQRPHREERRRGDPRPDQGLGRGLGGAPETLRSTATGAAPRGAPLLLRRRVAPLYRTSVRPG